MKERKKNLDNNITIFIKTLKNKITKESNDDLYKKLVENIDNPRLYKRYKDQLVINNVRLVINKVSEYIKSTKLLIFSDLVQEGITGLIKSIDTYNPDLKYNFSTWASIHIKKYILRHLDSMYMPKPHTQITENINRVRKIENKLYYRLNRKPTPEEVKEELDRQMKEKSADNKEKNKERLAKGLSPLSESIGVDKNGQFVGVSLDIIKYITNNINSNNILHSINLEQTAGNPEYLDNINKDSSYYDVHEDLIGNVMYTEMYEEIQSLLTILPTRYAEIIDMLLGISYERPYTLQEIKTVIYNPLDSKSYKCTLPVLNRLIKLCFNKIKLLDNIDEAKV